MYVYLMARLRHNRSNVCLISLLQTLVAQGDGEEKTGDTKEIGNKRNKPL